MKLGSHVMLHLAHKTRLQMKVPLLPHSVDDARWESASSSKIDSIFCDGTPRRARSPKQFLSLSVVPNDCTVRGNPKPERLSEDAARIKPKAHIFPG